MVHARGVSMGSAEKLPERGSEQRSAPASPQAMASMRMRRNADDRAGRSERGDKDSLRAQLVVRINEYEQRGAISAMDANTLRNQMFDSMQGQWRAVEKRLNELAMSWNPYQDTTSRDRASSAAAATSSSSSSSSPLRPGASCSSSTERRKLDYYELLQIEDRDHVTTDEIKRQFRKLALRFHPDKQRRGAPVERESATQEEEDGPDELGVKEGKTGEDSTQFARLRLAYETLIDADRRAAYDAQLAEQNDPKRAMETMVQGIHVQDQVTLEAATDFASLEWMGRVKHKMDVMDRIAEWAKILGVNATELRFETGEPCRGRGCGKIVSMDRDLECYGSPRRRVYVCLLHKYIHACDALCTSLYGDTEMDKKVCPIRAYWIVQNWLFDQLLGQRRQQLKSAEASSSHDKHGENGGEGENCVHPVTVELVPHEINLGDYHTSFRIDKERECRRETCASKFQFLEDGIFVCKRHGSPHVCTYEQCDRKHLDHGVYVCWVSHHVYGQQMEDVGTGTRTRRVIYTNAHGEEATAEMEVPVTLPLGELTTRLLDNGYSGEETPRPEVGSLSPPPPTTKVYEKSSEQTPDRHLRRQGNERRKLYRKLNQSEGTTYHIYLRVPRAVAALPRVSLELQEQHLSMKKDDDAGESNVPNDLLPIVVRAKDTVNYIKYWMEDLTEQQLSLWDQQIYWGDTLIGEEEHVMVLEEHGIREGCILDLRLHDDCPLLLATWSGKHNASASLPAEYNTVQISKEAEEEMEDVAEEWENTVAAEEATFEKNRLHRKRAKMEQSGMLSHVEVLQYDGQQPKLMGVVAERNRLCPKRRREHVDPDVDHPPSKRPAAHADRASIAAMRAVAAHAFPVKQSTTARSECNQMKEDTKR